MIGVLKMIDPRGHEYIDSKGLLGWVFNMWKQHGNSNQTTWLYFVKRKMQPHFNLISLRTKPRDHHCVIDKKAPRNMPVGGCTSTNGEPLRLGHFNCRTTIDAVANGS